MQAILKMGHTQLLVEVDGRDVEVLQRVLSGAIEGQIMWYGKEARFMTPKNQEWEHWSFSLTISKDLTTVEE